MSTKKKVAFVIVIAVLAVPTGYFALQFWDVAVYHGYRKGIIVQVRLIDLQHVVDSLAIEKGYFTCNLTFSNPTHETLNLRVLYVNYWGSPLRWRQFLIASGGGKTDDNINPGTTRISLKLEFSPDYAGNVLLVQQPLLDVSYSLKLGATAYAMRATVQNSTIQTEGPFYARGVDVTESTLTTYLLSIIAVWAIPFEIFAVAIIIQGRKAEEAALSHDKMLAVIYSLQCLVFIAAPFWGTIINFLIPPLPPPDFYYSSFAAGFAALLLFALALSISVVFFVTAYGFIRNRGWARKVAFPLSFLSILVWSYAEFHLVRAWFFEGLSTMYYLSLIFSILALAVANAIAVYVLVWRYLISRQARTLIETSNHCMINKHCTSGLSDLRAQLLQVGFECVCKKTTCYILGSASKMRYITKMRHNPQKCVLKQRLG